MKWIKTTAVLIGLMVFFSLNGVMSSYADEPFSVTASASVDNTVNSSADIDSHDDADSSAPEQSNTDDKKSSGSLGENMADTKDIETDQAFQDSFETTDKVVGDVDVVEFEEETDSPKEDQPSTEPTTSEDPTSDVPTSTDPPSIPEEQPSQPTVPGEEKPENTVPEETTSETPPTIPVVPSEVTPELNIPNKDINDRPSETNRPGKEPHSHSTHDNGKENTTVVTKNVPAPSNVIVDLPVVESFDAPIIVPEEEPQESLPKTGDTGSDIYEFICLFSSIAIIFLICVEKEGQQFKETKSTCRKTGLVAGAKSTKRETISRWGIFRASFCIFLNNNNPTKITD